MQIERKDTTSVFGAPNTRKNSKRRVFVFAGQRGQQAASRNGPIARALRFEHEFLRGLRVSEPKLAAVLGRARAQSMRLRSNSIQLEHG